MSTTGLSNAELGRKQLEVGYNRREMDVILTLYDENPVFVDHALNQTLTSIDEIREYVTTQWAASSADKVTIRELMESGDWTIARFVNRGVNDRPFAELEASNRPFEVELCTLSRWRDGKIVEDHVYYDLYGLLVQLGHVEPLTAASAAG
jgi:steroid delta-isomerase-like uncharacterized protein